MNPADCLKQGLPSLKRAEAQEVMVYFDPNIIKMEVDKYVWFYSPASHEFLKIKREDHEVLSLIEYIIATKGVINLGALKTYSEWIFRIKRVKIEELLDAICKLKRIFYLEKNQYLASIEKIKKIYNDTAFRLWRVYLHITHRCNFNCWYCYNHQITKDKNVELDAIRWQEIVIKLIRRGVRDFVITGGEPLLRWQDLYEILKKTRKEDANFTILTNGSLFSELIFKRLAPFVTRFVISLDSFSLKVQGTNRSPTGFKKIIRALELFAKHAPEKLTIRSVVTQNNLHEIDEIRSKLKEKFGISNYETVIFLPNKPQEIKLIPRLPMVVNIDDTYPDWFRKFSLLKYKCGAGSQIIAVDCRGDIYPCQNFVEEKKFKLGNMLNDDWYKSILYSSVSRLFCNLSVDNIKSCKDCSYRYLCGGGCPAISWRIYKSLNHHLPFLCDHLKYEAKLRLANAFTYKVEI